MQYQLARAVELVDPARGQDMQDKLVKLGYPAAFDNAGSLLLNHPKCRQHCINEAVKLFRKGAALGDPDAMMSLADQITKIRPAATRFPSTGEPPSWDTPERKWHWTRLTESERRRPQSSASPSTFRAVPPQLGWDRRRDARKTRFRAVAGADPGPIGLSRRFSGLRLHPPSDRVCDAGQQMADHKPGRLVTATQRIASFVKAGCGKTARPVCDRRCHYALGRSTRATRVSSPRDLDCRSVGFRGLVSR